MPLLKLCEKLHTQNESSKVKAGIKCEISGILWLRFIKCFKTRSLNN